MSDSNALLPDLSFLPGIKARLDRIDDLEALRDLKALYARRVDDNHRAPTPQSATAAADLFTNDAILDLGPGSRYEGRAQILNAFQNLFPAATAWSTHYIVNPLLQVNGNTATGTWYFLLYTQPKTSPPSPVLTLWGHYAEKYVKTNAGWKFKEVNGIVSLPVTTP
ncbi:nuclear transport factor 2 family protein [Chondromyces crocatus]|uniref:SnoaL-like domain-containing protein n=1 Tax=Chondromyces crocatus TaxID=52 RepID=A0A0K1EMP5_CHOCO|nr:nuclear transport factor 2 family protein [Chondromyces crocatus]AKT42180.1 uncharacterized protein CMC5_064030 [Chondromyces crocatus]